MLFLEEDDDLMVLNIVVGILMIPIGYLIRKFDLPTESKYTHFDDYKEIIFLCSLVDISRYRTKVSEASLPFSSTQAHSNLFAHFFTDTSGRATDQKRKKKRRENYYQPQIFT